MRRAEPTCTLGERNRFALCACDLVVGRIPVRQQPSENAIASPLDARGPLARIVERWPAGYSRKQRDLGEREIARRLVEIEMTGRFHSAEPRTKRHSIEILLEDLALAE